MIPAANPPKVLTRPIRDTAAASPGAHVSLSTYMADEHTRVSDYNGRKLISIVGRETFTGERVSRLPNKVIEFASRQPITSALLPCRVGFFPHARGHTVSRPSGDWSHILLLCIEGEGFIDLANARHHLTRGSFALLRPFEFHAYQADARNPWSLHWIHFNGRMAQEYYDALTAGGRCTHGNIGAELRLIQAFERIRNICFQGHSHGVLVQASVALHQLLGDLHGLIHRQEKSPEDVRTRIQRTIEAMQADPGGNTSIREFALAAHMSQMYFSEKFREFTGYCPRTFFNRVKMRKACELLMQTDLKIQLIARAVGFDDAFYFSRAFKRIVGQTPSEYRLAAGRAADPAAPR